MHQSSYRYMSEAVRTYLEPLADRDLVILDIGSMDVNGSYRPLFAKPSWRYVGVDLASGPNVEVVLESTYHLPFPNGHADVVVSGQTFEHVEFFWDTFKEMARVLRPGGYIILIAPSRGKEHRYPVDCWRFYPDGFRALGKLAQLEVLEARTNWPKKPSFWRSLAKEQDPWGDTLGVFRKPS